MSNLTITNLNIILTDILKNINLLDFIPYHIKYDISIFDIIDYISNDVIECVLYYINDIDIEETYSDINQIITDYIWFNIFNQAIEYIEYLLKHYFIYIKIKENKIIEIEANLVLRNYNDNDYDINNDYDFIISNINDYININDNRIKLLIASNLIY